MSPATLRSLHFASALGLGLFLALHLGNHLAGLAGQPVHQAYMAVARTLYRHPVVEPVLLVLVLWQAGSGVTMALRGWRGRRGRVAWLQALSGLYLAVFLINHVGAVLAARAWLGLDTDFRFAAAGFFVPPWGLFFAPYYFLAVFSLFAHLGCAAWWRLGPQRAALRARVLLAALVLGAGVALALVLALSGQLFPVDIPAAYRAPYGG